VGHGTRLEVLQRRRAFFRVRAPNGAEGWADQRQLLGATDVQNLERLAQLAGKMPTQGAARPRYGDMRIYTLPSRESPSFVTVKDKENVEVLGHVVVERAHLERAPLLPPPPKKLVLKKKEKEARIPPVPMPKPPALPPDWQELSKTEADPDEPPAKEPPAPPAPTEDWSLVRTGGGQAGWTLTRRLDMAIPDEVAQYAEGRRIVGYFPLGAVNDGDQKKNTWLWTTSAEGMHPYDFDSFRVFMWSLKRHRYETSYIERNVTGFEPVLLETVTFGGTQYPGFSVCVKKKDLSFTRREYAMLGNIARLAGERGCEARDLSSEVKAAMTPAKPLPGETQAAQPAAEKPSFAARVKQKIGSWFKK
jgi:hypothetical protein